VDDQGKSKSVSGWIRRGLKKVVVVEDKTQEAGCGKRRSSQEFGM
jgi:hypothetical protein